MKFWHRICIGVFVVFILAFDAGAFYLTVYAYNFNRRSETDSGIREQGVVLSSITSRITSAETFYPDTPDNEERLLAVIRPLADFYSRQGVLLALYNKSYEIYADIPDIDIEMLNLSNTQEKNIMETTINGMRHVIVASKIPGYEHLTFIYARNISQIDSFRADVGRAFVIMNAVVMLFLGCAIYLVIKWLTRPIAELTTITAEIANGAYEKRASTNRNDELGELAISFNRMADSVQENMEDLTKSAIDRQQFIDDLTHEIKTPLTSILGYSEYLQNAKSTEEERIVAAGHLHKMALRLKSLSDKLLDITFLRGESIKFSPVNVSILFNELKDIVSPVLTDRNLRLVVSSNIAHINGDETLLLSLLVNLVENAARASEEGASIIVNAYKKQHKDADVSVSDASAGFGGEAIDASVIVDSGISVIEVVDNGCGMDKREIEKITTPFYRIDKSRSRKYGGVGLGLNIVSRIVALHGAKIDIISNPGKGTAVRIYFSDL